MRIVGAGFGRTGTVSLKLAIELLLDGPCYHMTEQLNRQADAAVWSSALEGEVVDWPEFLHGWVATVDWPGCLFAVELSEAFPEAKVLLSVRDGESWWESASRTIFPSVQGLDDEHPFKRYLHTLFARSGIDMTDKETSIAGFEAHNHRVRDAVAPHRLVEWHLGDGWEKICASLELPVPEQDFPHANSRSDYQQMVALAAAGQPPRIVEPPPTQVETVT